MSDRPLFTLACVSLFILSLHEFYHGRFMFGAMSMGAGIVYVLLATRRR